MAQDGMGSDIVQQPTPPRAEWDNTVEKHTAFSSLSHSADSTELQTGPSRPDLEPRYATTDDWKVKKGLIKTLYVTQNRTLARVVKIMESEHGFKATERMYKRRFTVWGWHKNASKKWRQTTPDPVPDKTRGRATHPRGTLTAGQPSKHIISSRAIGESPTLTIMPHENDETRCMGTLITAVRHYMDGSAEDHDVPCWMTTSKYENPFSATGKNWAEMYASPVYYSMRSALWSFSQGDGITGGRLLRRTFRILDERLQGLRDGRPVVASYCCSIVVFLVSSRRTDLAVMFLKFVTSRVSLISRRHPLALMCEPLLSVLLRKGGKDHEAFVKLSLVNVLKVEAASLADLRGPEHRDRVYFWSRYDAPIRVSDNYGVGEDLRVLSTDRVEQISTYYDSLLRDAEAEFGDMIHPTYLFLEGATISFHARWGYQRDVAIKRSEGMFARLRKHYSDRGLPVEAWSEQHQQAYIEVSTYLWPLYLWAGRADEAIDEARKLASLRATTFKTMAGSWIGVDILVLWFESFLIKAGRKDDAEYFSTWRLACDYYTSLEHEFAAEEEEFVQTRLTQEPVS